jgi:phosphate transport system protein
MPTGGAPIDAGLAHTRAGFEQRLSALKKRLMQEATAAVAMLQGSLEALWKLDRAAAKDIRRRDDTIDREEVEIEQECFRILTLEGPMARDFRTVTFILKANQEVERVGDHASSICKIIGNMRGERPPKWPTSLVDMGERVPMMCHALLRAVIDEDTTAARTIVAEDKVIDGLEKRLFEETVEMMRGGGDDLVNGMLIYRIGRELERVADLMTNIAEDVIYLATGEIVRHDVKKNGGQGVPRA